MARGQSWSRLEVEATVASYFDMLRLELQGGDYNKSARRRQLQEQLDGRSEGSIERKHQNISAVLIELGLPYVDGYKPLSNYQELLAQVVQERLSGTPELIEQVVREVEREAEVPDVDDILAVLVDPPARPSDRVGRYVRERARPPSSHRPNYLLREIRNASLGKAGERFVLNFERARLMAERLDRLAARVEHVAETRGDHEGYDILSFEGNGAERLIEVKTTRFGQYTPFFATANEVETSRRHRDQYRLYRLFSFHSEPRLFTVSGSLEQAFDLTPTEFQARLS